MLALPLLCQWNQDTGMHQETKSLTLKFGRVFQYNGKKNPERWSGQSGAQQIEIFLYFVYRLYWWKLLVLTLLTNCQKNKTGTAAEVGPLTESTGQHTTHKLKKGLKKSWLHEAVIVQNIRHNSWHLMRRVSTRVERCIWICNVTKRNY